MSGTGTGVPLYFMCWAARQGTYRHDPREQARLRAGHKIELTGNTRPTPYGKAHPRKSNTTREYRCSCGHVGWSNHFSLERMERRNEQITTRTT